LLDIGGLELLLVAIVGLLIVGPERLPEVLRSFGLWIGRLKRAFHAAKTEIEQEIGMDDIQRQLHNESVLKEIKKNRNRSAYWWIRACNWNSCVRT